MSDRSQRLKGRTALVTGSTSGIGFAIAEKLAEDGAKVIVSSRHQKNVDNAVKYLLEKGYDVHGVVCHIDNANQRQNLVKVVEQLGGLDIFVQSAGVNPYKGFVLDCPEGTWDKIFNTNVKNTWLLTKELFHLLQKSTCGRVIYNSSLAAFSPYQILGAYPIAKVALISLTKMVALDLGRWNVTVNCLVPGFVDTPFSEDLWNDKPFRDSFILLSALKRVGRPEEVAGLASFLASDDSSYITGEAICLGGGYLSRL